MRLAALVVICYWSLVIGGCGESTSQREVVLYTSVDEPIARPIVREFEKATGTRVVLVTDAEATKSVGLAERVRAEKGQPRCDVFWSNEPFHSINLAQEGLLEPYESPSAKDVSERFKDAKGRWCGNGLRARVIVLAGDREKHVDADWVTVRGLHDLIDERVKGKIVMADPTAGTTAGHVAALYVLWGEKNARDFFASLRRNETKLVGGNSVVADQVGQGQFLYGLTDNDDAAAAAREGGHLTMMLPDQHIVGEGTLMIPTTVGFVKGAPHAAEAKKLIDYLLSAEVEKELMEAKFAGWSVRGSSGVKMMEVDYGEVARVMPRASREARDILVGRE